MSTDGAQRSQSQKLKEKLTSPLENYTFSSRPTNKLVEQLREKKEVAAQSLMKSNPTLLHQAHGDTRVYPLHVAAEKSLTQTFLMMLELGANPFEVDFKGQSVYFVAHKSASTKILEWCKSFFTDLSWVETESEGESLDEMLLKHGFHTYIINEFNDLEDSDDDKPELTSQEKLLKFFKELFQKGSLPPFLENCSPQSRWNKIPDGQQVIEPVTLKNIAWGLVDSNCSGVQIIHMLTTLFPTLDYNQQLACIFLIKEYMKSDYAHEWIVRQDFRQAFEAFLEKMGNKPAWFKSIQRKLQRHYLSLLPNSHLLSAADLTFDLTKAFRSLIIQFTPTSFSQGLLQIKNKDKNKSLVALSDFHNSVTAMVRLDIASAKTPQEIVERIQLYIDVITMCLKHDPFHENDQIIYNYPAAVAVYTGLAVSHYPHFNQFFDRLKGSYLERYKTYKEHYFNGDQNVNQAITEHPKCIPLLNMLSNRKDSAGNVAFSQQIPALGRMNQGFNKKIAYLSSLHHFDATPYKTDFMVKVAHSNLDEDYAKACSFQLVPFAIIDLDAKPSLDNIILLLEAMHKEKADLVVLRNKKRHLHEYAFEQLSTFLKKHYPNRAHIKTDSMDVEQPKQSSDSSADPSLEKVLDPADIASKKRKISKLSKEILANYDEIISPRTQDQKEVDEITLELEKVTFQSRDRSSTTTASPRDAILEQETTRKRSATHIPEMPGTSVDIIKDNEKTRRDSSSKKMSIFKDSSYRETKKLLSSPRTSSPSAQASSSTSQESPRTFTPNMDRLAASSSSPILALPSSAATHQQDSVVEIEVKRGEKKKKRHQTALPGDRKKK